jgi:hypothetical protein
MNRSADLSQAEDAERHLGQRKKPVRPPLVSYTPPADQQSRTFDADERFDADESYAGPVTVLRVAERFYL